MAVTCQVEQDKTRRVQEVRELQMLNSSQGFSGGNARRRQYGRREIRGEGR